MSITPAAQRSSLSRALKSHVRGEVRFDPGSRALYATDASNYRQVPTGVVIPRDEEDLIAAVEICRDHAVSIVHRGGGTSLAGQACNSGVVIDGSKYLNRIVAVDPDRRTARVQPGVVLDDLRRAAEAYGLTFGPDPATHDRCTIGGMIGNNSCGAHSLMSGKTDANVEALDILTYDGVRLRLDTASELEREQVMAGGGRQGEIYTRLYRLQDRYADHIRQRFPAIPRRVSGYNLNFLLPEHGFDLARSLVGSEGTCVTILEATLTLIERPAARALLVIGFADIFAAADRVPMILEQEPIGLEGFDGELVDDMRRKRLKPEEVACLPEGNGWLLVEFGGRTPEEAETRARDLAAALRAAPEPASAQLFTGAEAAAMWGMRESALGATAIVPGRSPTWPGWEDSAVGPHRLGEYLRALRELQGRYGYRGAFYGHFGEGCVHTRSDFDFGTPEGVRRFRGYIEEAADLVIGFGGSLSGEHGDGQARGELLERMYGPDLVGAFREFKAIWDPDGGMNPGKLVNAHRIDQHLRLARYRPTAGHTHFSFAADGGSVATAALRCVGVGACRRRQGGTMCPSYMATGEEQHSTRGRARLLFEMLRGDVLNGGWRNKEVREALDLCLACKACKSECPTQVDMATYKAEFLSHYYAGRLRPRSAYSMGLVYWWARLGALHPRLTNALTQTPVLAAGLKRAGGVAPERRIPVMSPQTFRQWFRGHAPAHPSGPRVLLWVDTFNNHFHAETAKAAVEVLESAGYQVIVPSRSLCCGRPLYDFGFLGRAKKLLEEILEALEPEIRAGTPVVGLEPSCVAVFRDEMLNLFPGSSTANRLADQTYLLSEFLGRQGFRPPPLGGRALVQRHCHQRAVLDMSAEQSLLTALELDLTVPDSGCCGMAGAFGFEREHYSVSVACAERVLAPAIRQTTPDTLLIADGFSCREQILQLTGRRTFHLAEVLRMALRGEQWPVPRSPVVSSHTTPVSTVWMAVGLALVAAASVWKLRKR